EFNANGSFKSHNVEDDKKQEHEWFSGVRLKRNFGIHGIGLGLEYGNKERNDEKTTLKYDAAGNLTSTTAGGRGDNFDIKEERWVAYALNEIRLLHNHIVTPGLRMQRLSREAVDGIGEKFNSSIETISPSLHYLWQVDSRNNIRASITETVKPPKFDDLSPVTESKSGTLSDPDKTGNPDLDPEKALGFELGWDHFLPRGGGVLGVNFFQRNIEDKIEGRIELENGRYISRPDNVGDAKVWGWELDARPRMDLIGLPELMLRFNYTRLYSELKDTETGLNTRIKDQPPYVYNVGFDWQLPRWDAAFGLNYNYTPKFTKNPVELTKLDPEAEQKLLDIYLLKRLNKDYALRVTASNLLNMSKDKDKYEYNSTTGNVTKYTQESETAGPTLFFALEGKF
ncbi:MAG: TonB-dependent receptor, partial [Nitrosomonadales bacterium]|nr:TonB-dependent receptor [Nitrosomonadales bacterium]